MKRVLLAGLLGALGAGAPGGPDPVLAAAPRSWGVAETATAAPAVAIASWPRFVLFGWVSPPLEMATPARYAELAEAGFNLVQLAWQDSGRVATNLARLDMARPLGLHCLLLDVQLDEVHPGFPPSLALADTIVARYRDDPAFQGWYLGDEPRPADFPRLGEWFGVLRDRDPAHPAWNNLLPRAGYPSQAEFLAYLRAYVAAVGPAVLCNDEYEFLQSGDQGLLAENIAGMSTVARENGLPFWGIVLLTQHGGYREVTEGMLRWQYAQWLAWGARGIGVFTYWTPAPDPFYDWQPAMIEWGTGARTPHYEIVRALNAQAAAVGNTLAGARWLDTRYAGGTPTGGTAFERGALVDSVGGRATLGFFADSTAAPLLFVANADSFAARTVTVGLAGGRSAWALRTGDGAWVPLAAAADGRLALDLAPGDFTLLRLSGRVDSLVSTRPPWLSAAPNPARGAVRFTVTGTEGASRLDVLDLTGRRVWSHALPAGLGERSVAWTGERDEGGLARPGIYFARLEDARGTATRRIAWLGRR